MEQQNQFNDMFKNIPEDYNWQISSGISQLDTFLGGGLLKGAICQMYGQSGTGKTQLAMQFMIGAALMGSASHYISTDKIIHLQRFKGLKINFENRIKRQISPNWEIDHCTNTRPFQDTYRNFMNKIQRSRQKSIDLLIIDNITRVINDKISLEQQLTLKSDAFSKAKIQKLFINNLRMQAKKHRFAVLLINNAAALINQNNNNIHYREKNINAALGKSWDSQMDESIWVSKNDYGSRKLKMMYSPKAKCCQINFKIEKDGGFIF